MANKPSGLGRGLVDLLDDNNPSLHPSRPNVVVRSEVKQGTQTKQEPQQPIKIKNSLYDTTPKPLFEPKPRNKGFK